MSSSSKTATTTLISTTPVWSSLSVERYGRASGSPIERRTRRREQLHDQRFLSRPCTPVERHTRPTSLPGRLLAVEILRVTGLTVAIWNMVNKEALSVPKNSGFTSLHVDSSLARRVVNKRIPIKIRRQHGIRACHYHQQPQS